MSVIRVSALIVAGVVLTACSQSETVTRNAYQEPLVDIAPAIAPMPIDWTDEADNEAALSMLTSQWVPAADSATGERD